MGRGAPELDLFRLVVPPKWEAWERGAHITTALRAGPRLPPNTTHGAGPAGDCNATTDACTGVRFAPGNAYATGMAPCMRSGVGDCIGAASTLYETHFEEAHVYGMRVEPGEWVAWYLDDVLLFNVTKEALTPKTNPANASQTVGVCVAGGI